MNISDNFLLLCDEVLKRFVDNRLKTDALNAETTGLNTSKPFNNLSRAVSIREWNEVITKLKRDEFIKAIPFSKEHPEMTFIHTATEHGVEFCRNGGYRQQQIELLNKQIEDRKNIKFNRRIALWTIITGILSFLSGLIIGLMQSNC